MLPKLVFSSSDILLQQYIDTFIESHNIDRHYVYHVKAEKTELSIEQIREVKKEIITSSGRSKAFFLHSFETASTEAQNALLKTLEEMQDKHMFILLTGNKERVLPTIHSRVELVDLEQKEQEYNIREETINWWNDVILPRSYSSMQSPLISGITRDQVILLLDECIILMKKKLQSEPGLVAHIKFALQKKDLLISHNLNPQLAVDSFILHMISRR
jgi:DNA polymerase III delta prime subunit